MPDRCVCCGDVSRRNTSVLELFKRGTIFAKKEENHAKVKTITKGVRA